MILVTFATNKKSSANPSNNPLTKPTLQKNKVSAVIITFNAARLLTEVLQALSWAAEVVVVDSGSTDDTLRIATQHNCRTAHRHFDGYGNQKHFAVAMAQNDWVLVVDADEVVTPELAREIQDAVQNTTFQGYMVPISLIFMGKLMRYGREYKMPHLRLFNKKFGNYNNHLVHEDVVLDGQIGKLKNQMLHDSYGSVSDFIQKLNRYTTASAEAMQSRKKKGAVRQIITRFPITFLKEYLIGRNFLNGFRGFVWAFFMGVYAVLKYVKLWELQRTAQSNKKIKP